MFRREHHRRIATVLEALDGPRLLAHRCLFGGGTAIALRHGEYRESVDIDFIVSDIDGYGGLRAALTGPENLQSITRRGHAPLVATRLRADQYGIRAHVAAGGLDIKLEIVLEARIELEAPHNDDIVCGVATLSRLDMLATKLLANADRWRDDGAFSRDLIDLAMMQATPALVDQAVTKARAAYGESVLRDLGAAIDTLRQRTGRLDRCIAALAMDTTRVALWDKIRKLERATLKPRGR